MAADLNQLLEGSSRTFALTIPLLPEPRRREVTVAYLLFRIADTLEDGESWDPARRARGLRTFESLLVAELPAESAGRSPGEPSAGRLSVDSPASRSGDSLLIRSPLEAEAGSAARASAAGPAVTLEAFTAALLREPPTAHAGYRALLAQTQEVFLALRALGPGAREVVLRHLLVTVRGMAEELEDAGGLRLRSLTQLRRYCYLVAGVVGEMLTELFLLDAPASEQLAKAAGTLRANARAFGEGLQLTNILKDQGEDAAEARHFVPETVERGSLFALARKDLSDAARYVGALLSAHAPEGFVAFTALPVRLALDTLAAVEQRGAGAKVSREQLAEAMAEVAALLRGEKLLASVMRLDPASLAGSGE
jgi:farnesyl-diphosphate farnesyltransferase